MTHGNDRAKTGALSNGYSDELAIAKDTVSKITNSKRLILAGFLVAITGVASYCYLSLSSVSANSSFVFGTLAVISSGFILWLAGAISYFNLAIDAGDSDTVF